MAGLSLRAGFFACRVWHSGCSHAVGFNLQDTPTMSFRRRNPSVLASGILGAAVGFALVGGAIALLSLPALA